MTEECIFTCPQCPKIFATRSNLKRHMENPNIHNIPYTRSRDQKRWQGHSKKVSSRQETTERMRKWRAENRDKNKRNDLRCRVYRLARQKYGEQDSVEKQQFIEQEINTRLGKRLLNDQKNESLNELPFYSAPLQKIELPSLTEYHMRSQPTSPTISSSTIDDNNSHRRNSTNSITTTITSPILTPPLLPSASLPPMQSFLTSIFKQENQ
ncbi:hypothetical protein EDC94DRAFT_598126 [Helicostylum pulchrum]|uniref:C2H2-type domain-containing protein n=1 Tax=Helicostylum pulchrum TaxID=562976 RepID=A0ABP9XY07_9FUNG|nr:hypothetical protein EDC94DRAFT_598126 [Helicostylum pulchrum]